MRFGRPARAVLGVGAALVALGLAVRLLNPLPSLDGRSASQALPRGVDTPLRRAVAPLLEHKPGLSGVHPLATGPDAFAARVALTRVATKTLDLQYYIWHADLSGALLFDEVRRAADRGVRVRLLLDDNTTKGVDPFIAALDRHPNVEVRLFNPFTIRELRPLAYLTDFARLNRRMHNKAFIADNQAAVIGGRNVGDEYFGAGDGTRMVDLDLLAVGPVIADLSRSFDAYWGSASAYPAASILGPRVRPADLAAAAETAAGTAKGHAYAQAVASSTIATTLGEGRLSFIWAPARMAADDPAKGLGRAPPDALLWPKLTHLLGRPRHDLALVSGYFVPTRAGVDAFLRLAQEGVRVKILTNSFAATDVPIVHSGYAKWRQELLRGGVELYELRREPGEGDTVKRNVTALGSTGSGGRGAGSALHAKTFGVDGQRLFVGSFNFDPRSANLNTELGFVIDSPELAGQLRTALGAFIPANTYRLELSRSGELRWREQVGDRQIVHAAEPHMTFRQRLVVALLSHLPIEWLL